MELAIYRIRMEWTWIRWEVKATIARIHEYSGEEREVRQTRRNKFFIMFDHKVAEECLSDVIQSSFGHALTYYHTMDGNMCKEWMNEKRTKKDFLIHKDDDETRILVRLPDGKSEEEVEPLNLMIDETGEFNEVVKKYILNGMSDYPQCFITIMAYNLIWTQNGELKILTLTDYRLGHLLIFHKDHINKWLVKWGSEVVQKCFRRTRDRRKWLCLHGWIGFHIEMFPLETFVGYKHQTHLRSLDNQLSTPISMTTGDCNDVSFWQVKMDTKSLQIVRWVVRLYTTSGGNNPTSTRYSV